MTSYAAPIDDMQFILHDMLDAPSSDIPGYGDLDRDFTAAIIGEAGKLGSEVLHPLNAVGDREGLSLIHI